jgi:hypothetical protein
MGYYHAMIVIKKQLHSGAGWAILYKLSQLGGGRSKERGEKHEGRNPS